MNKQTLERRALGLIPQYFRRTTLPNSEGTNWLRSFNLDPSIIKDVQRFTTDYLPILQTELGEITRDSIQESNLLPGVAPLVIVLDSLTTIIGETDEVQLQNVCMLVRFMKRLNCIVLLLSAEDIPQGSRLEYLVDTVINLKHEGTGNVVGMPFRLFQLFKTRLQMSRTGSHILHLSGEQGLRLSPQVSAALDSHKIHETRLPDRRRVIDTLRTGNELRQDRRQLTLSSTDIPARLVKLFPGSKILVHGHGSSGKAALALRILMAPSLDIKTGILMSSPRYKRPKILVISFLYPEEHYKSSFKKLSHIIDAEMTPKMTVKALTPGFIRPEDFISEVLLELDQGHLEGWPYTGVLLDGLHNTFLQFPSLQAMPMVWPALYSLLSRYELTIVSTFTTFEKTHPEVNIHNQFDEELLLQGQLPFLHVLVQGTDFYLQVEPPNKKHDERTFHITVKSALGQHKLSGALLWNAEECTFGDYVPIETKHETH